MVESIGTQTVKPPSMENGPESMNTPTVQTTFSTRAADASHAVHRGSTPFAITHTAYANAVTATMKPYSPTRTW